ncbi:MULTISPECIES: FAD-dependent monooxygenase [unclassified Streptomyces]|jgi:2-polyprenyl-6-methoxyphenol hydroxylase-like FAD-dependent oxidoreductase|uniref:FAD-dependent monooxygenase n=1 Tax=unclassified Streptomyces TaxID=2593676 RepID=UPI0029A081A7|nr:FAD-dependent monooxygenase [Streptomyces sp. FL07-04A]MDX3579239.1 FAD-dependent monooxygenase [Streptomyces sp. FL07-04A]
MSDPVIIVGGGAAGLMLACELGLAEVPVVVLERRVELPERSGGMLLNAHIADFLRMRGLAGRFFGPDTPTWGRSHFGLVYRDIDGELAKTDYDLIVPQWRSEQLLRERAAELGVEVRLGAEVVGVEQDADGVTLTVGGPQGAQRMRARYAVGCDGPRSAVAQAAGFDFDVLAPSYYGVIADVVVDDESQALFRAGSYPCGQFGVLPVNPADPSEVRLMTVEFDREPPPDAEPLTVREIRSTIERITGRAPDLRAVRWMTRYGSPTRLARRYRVGRVFLAGDAAHPHPPSSGHGMNTAVHDAVNLGWKLAGAVRGWAPDGLLDTYHDERRPVGERACRRALAQIPLQTPLERAAPLREIFAELMRSDDVNAFLVQYVTRVRYPFAEEGAPAHPLLGAVLPDVSLRTPDGVVAAGSLLSSGRGLVLGPASPGGGPLPDLSAWADRLDVVAAEPSVELGAEAVLVRPDGHVAWAGPAGAHDGLLLAVKTWFG